MNTPQPKSIREQTKARSKNPKQHEGAHKYIPMIKTFVGGKRVKIWRCKCGAEL